MFRRKSTWIALFVLLLGLALGGYFVFVRNRAQVESQAQTPTVASTQVSRGDLVISASGSGTLIPASEVATGFQTGGILKEVLVAIGDKVEAGQPLARLVDTDAAAQVIQAEINLRLAQISLEELSQAADATDLAAAQASLASAKASLANLTAAPGGQELLAARETLKSAQNQLAKLLAGPDQTEVKNAQYALETAKNSLWSQQVSRDSACGGTDKVRCDQGQASVGNADAAVRKAQEELDLALAGATADEISDARAKVAQAQAQVDSLLKKPNSDELAAAQGQVTKAQGDLDALMAGAATTELEKTQLSVRQAELSLESAQRSLAETTLTAPAAGTVTALAGRVGEAVGSGAIITLSELDNPQLQFWVEETDLASAAPGNGVNVVFEALPDLTFAGKILRVEPVLVTQDNTPAVQVLASIDMSSQPVKLLSGMNAEVEVIAGEARNALLVPIEALRELGTDQYAVFVILANGELEMRPVEVGLRDFVNAEILSGVEEGETVRLGTEQSGTASSDSSNRTQNQTQTFGGPIFFEGGGGPPR